VEEMIVKMKMATPTEGLITLSGTANPHLFSMAKVGLGTSASDLFYVLSEASAISAPHATHFSTPTNLCNLSGSLGVVTEMTLQCIPQMNLLEESSVCDRSDMDVTDHVNRLRSYRHVRYMWVPYTNTVVTVVSNPTTDVTLTPADLMANAENQSGNSCCLTLYFATCDHGEQKKFVTLSYSS
jgi:L-galactono-1,4-lactone dehydrogenase